MLQTIGTEYDYKGDAEAINAATDSEEARKRLRIARMRKQTAYSELQGVSAVPSGLKTVGVAVFNDPEADHWQKE